MGNETRKYDLDEGLLERRGVPVPHIQTHTYSFRSRVKKPLQ